MLLRFWLYDCYVQFLLRWHFLHCSMFVRYWCEFRIDRKFYTIFTFLLNFHLWAWIFLNRLLWEFHSKLITEHMILVRVYIGFGGNRIQFIRIIRILQFVLFERMNFNMLSFSVENPFVCIALNGSILSDFHIVSWKQCARPAPSIGVFELYVKNRCSLYCITVT